jgi:homocitrate synthase NifV
VPEEVPGPSGPREVRLVDTTLRDGLQSPGLALSLENRVRLASALDRAGISRIEAGSPCMGEGEATAVRAVVEAVTRSEVSAWNRLRPEDVSASLGAGPDVIHICLPASERQLRSKLGIGWPRAEAVLESCLSLCRARGARFSVGLEDVSRAAPAHLERVMGRLLDLGAFEVRLADTVGVLTPLRTAALVTEFKSRGFTVGFHAHNDLGLAAANSLVAALSGADSVDVTLLGVGERAGNASLSGFLGLAGHSGSIYAAVRTADAVDLEEGFRPLLEREGFLLRLALSEGSDITDVRGSIGREG